MQHQGLKWTGLFLSIVLVVGTLTGCAAETDGKGTIYYLVPGMIDEFQTVSVEAIEDTFTSMGYEVKTLDGQNRSDVQLNQIEDALLLNPSALIVNAVDFDALVPGVEKAKADGIPVIVFDRPIKSTETDLTSIAGTVEMGHTAAREVARLLEERYGAVQGTVLQILGDPGDNYTLDIQQGFEERMGAHPDVEIITKAAMQWEASNAGDIAEDQLLVQPDLDLIFVHAAHLAVPVVAVLEAKGKQPGEVMLVSSNGAPVGLDLIRQGWEQVEVEQPLYAQVYGMAMFMDKVLAGEPLTPGTYQVLGQEATLSDEPWGMTLTIPGTAITPENVDDERFWGNMQPPADPVPMVE